MDLREEYMRTCLKLGAKGLGHVAPNPMVGCVIVHNNEIIGEGYHQKYGEAHAEVNAINSVLDKSLLSDSTLYVNLEPCSHYGKTPPCAALIVKHKIPRVIIGSLDKNPLVGGKGIEKLKNNGCQVEVGIFQKECNFLNRRFFTFHEKKRPYIILKWAETLDGFIDKNRSSFKEQPPLSISGAEAKSLAHKWRSEEQAILVGTNTALLDNPRLTTRDVVGKNPLRILIDNSLKVPQDYFLLDGSSETIVFTSSEQEEAKNIKYITIDFEKDIWPQVFGELYKKNIQSVIVEGGAQILNSLILSGLWDEARVFVSPDKIIKGVSSPTINIPPFSEETTGPDKLRIFFNQG